MTEQQNWQPGLEHALRNVPATKEGLTAGVDIAGRVFHEKSAGVADLKTEQILNHFQQAYQGQPAGVGAGTTAGMQSGGERSTR